MRKSRRLAPAQRKLIRDHGKRLAGSGSIRMELGERFYIGADPKWEGWSHWNLHPDLSPPDEDTDLWDNLPWEAVASMDILPKARLDFYVYTVGHYGELRDNLIVHIEGGRVVELRRTTDEASSTIWKGEV